MLVKTNELIVTSFEESESYMENMINSIKLDFGKMNSVGKEASLKKINRCTNVDCRAVFSINDTADLISMKEYLDNKTLFGPKAKLNTQDFVENKKKVWICRYCGQFQPIADQHSFIMGGSVKFPIDENEISKGNNDPIILFIIDSSSSMEAVISQLSQDKVETELKELMQKAQLVQKNKARESQTIKRIMKRNNVRQNIQPQNNFINKKNFMLAILTKVLRQLRIKVKSENDENRKIGFLFFNQNIFLVNDGLTEDYTIIHDVNQGVWQNFDVNQTLLKKPNKSQFRSVNFMNCKQLFKIGAQHGHKYQTKVKDLDIGKMDFPGVPSDGKTALGPALAIALGIISKHGQGSTVVVVTDGIANVGILEAETEDVEAERFIVQNLRSLKCLVGILQWADLKPNNQIKLVKPNQVNYFNKFVDKNTKILQRYEINVSINMEAVNLHIAALQNLAFRKIIAVIKKFNILCSADFITFQKTKFEESMLDDGDLISSNKSFFFNIKLNKPAITEQSYLQPVITQCAIDYYDLKTKRFMCFVSQLKQTLSKSQRKIISLINFQNIQQYFDNEDLHNFSERCTINGRERSIRETFNSVCGSMTSRKAKIDEIHDHHEATQRSIGSRNRI